MEGLEDRRTGLVMALAGFFEPGFSPSRVVDYREELDYIDSEVSYV